MPRLEWDNVGEKTYETGTDRGVLYKQDNKGEYPAGVAWNGLTAVSESPSGADSNPLYADNIKYLDLRSAEEFGATIEAYTYPEEFEECDGTREIAPGAVIGQQNRKPFGFCYRSILGNDTELNDHGYLIHIIYGMTASPSEKGYQSVNDSPEAISFSWEVTTVPVPVPGFKPTATIVVNSTKVDAAKLKALEDILYGSEEAAARLPLPAEIIEILSGSTTGGQG